MTGLPLSRLNDWQLVDPTQDVRGRRLVDVIGRPLGKIDDMIVDTENQRVESVRTDNQQLFPVEALEIRDDYVIWHGAASGAHGPRLAGRVVIVRRLGT